MFDTWRTHALVVALAAMSAQLIVLVLIGVFHLPDRDFTTSSFRCIALVYVAFAVIVARWFAAEAFRAAQAGGYVRCLCSAQRRVWVSPRCPRRMLVLLHVRLHRYRQESRWL